jgi:hypothetical protein
MNEKALGRALRLLAINVYTQWGNLLMGSAPPRIQAAYERMKNPQVGDVVLETSTMWQNARNADGEGQFPNIGTLLRVAQEPIMSAEDFAKMHADGDYWERADETLDDIPKERVYYIAPLDGSVPEYRWTNASFIRVFTSLDESQ